MRVSDNFNQGKLKQFALYWPKIGTNQEGQPVYGSLSEISCRWEDKQEITLTKKGRSFTSMAVVYVDRDLIESSVLMLSPIQSCGGYLQVVTLNQTDPYANNGAWEVSVFQKIPNNCRNAKYSRIAILGHRSNEGFQNG